MGFRHTTHLCPDTLIVDTGSSNTWVGAGKEYIRTSTSVNTSSLTFVSYEGGNFSGREYFDQVSLASGLIISNQSIGVATSSTGFVGVDGVLGIGPVDLTKGTVFGEDTVPTVTDNLFSQVGSDLPRQCETWKAYEDGAVVGHHHEQRDWGILRT